MSFTALAAIRNVDAPGASSVLLLFILAEYAGPDGCCFPSQATLSERSKLSVRAVRDNLHALEDAGLIVQERRNRKNGERTSNRIRLLYYTPEQAAESAASVAAIATGSLTSDRDRPAADFAATLGDDCPDQRQQTTRQPAAGADLTSLEPVSEPITSPAGRDVDQAFDDFWQAYPCKVEEHGSRRLFGSILKRGAATAEQLIAGARSYAAQVRGRDPEFIKHATTWLQREGWLDAPSPSTPGASAPAQGFSRTAFAGPSELRRAIVEIRGEAWAQSWLDRCGWDPEARALIAPSGIAFDRLRQELGRHLRDLRVTVTEPRRKVG